MGCFHSKMPWNATKKSGNYIYAPLKRYKVIIMVSFTSGYIDQKTIIKYKPYNEKKIDFSIFFIKLFKKSESLKLGKKSSKFACILLHGYPSRYPEQFGNFYSSVPFNCAIQNIIKPQESKSKPVTPIFSLLNRKNMTFPLFVWFFIKI